MPTLFITREELEALERCKDALADLAAKNLDTAYAGSPIEAFWADKAAIAAKANDALKANNYVMMGDNLPSIIADEYREIYGKNVPAKRVIQEWNVYFTTQLEKIRLLNGWSLGVEQMMKVYMVAVINTLFRRVWEEGQNGTN